MKKNSKNPIWSWMVRVTFILMAGLFGTTSFASELPRGLVIADNEGIAVQTNGQYFIDITDILPGETYTKEITFRNTDKDDPFELGLRVHPKESTGSINWNDHVTMTLNMDGKELYKGKLLGNGQKDWTKEFLSLGSFSYGSDKVLKVTFEVDSNLTNKDFAEKNRFLYEWEFVATRNGEPVKPEPKNKEKSLFKLPQTGEEWSAFLYQVLAGLLLLLIVLLLWKKKRQAEQAEKRGEDQ